MLCYQDQPRLLLVKQTTALHVITSTITEKYDRLHSVLVCFLFHNVEAEL